MMRIAILKIVALFALTLAPASLSAQTLWENVDAGMFLTQVQNAQPKAVEPETKSTLIGGHTCRLKIHDYRYLSHTFEVCFYFIGRKLTQVTMKLKGRATEELFDAVVADRTKKWGDQVPRRENSFSKDALWRNSEGVELTMVFFHNSGLFNQNFRRVGTFKMVE